MSSVVIAGNTSGTITVSAPDVSGSNTLTLPAVTSTIATNVNGTLYPLVSGTAVASTSGTSIDFTGIPNWVKRITIMFSGVSTNGASNRLVQIGAGSVTTSGYVSSGAYVKAGGSVTSSTAGFVMWDDSATFTLCGHMILTNVSGNIWASSHSGKVNTDQVCVGGGDVTLGGTLDRVRITAVNGTDTFDAGTINIFYE